MLVVISPAKKLDMSVDDRAPTTVPVAADAETLAGVARELSHDDLRALMSISPALAGSMQSVLPPLAHSRSRRRRWPLPAIPIRA